MGHRNRITSAYNHKENVKTFQSGFRVSPSQEFPRLYSKESEVGSHRPFDKHPVIRYRP